MRRQREFIQERCFKISMIIDLVLIILLISGAVYQGNNISLIENKLYYITMSPVEQQSCLELCLEGFTHPQGQECCSEKSEIDCRTKASCKKDLQQSIQADIYEQKRWLYGMLACIAFFLFSLSILGCLKLLIKKQQEGLQRGTRRVSIVGVRLFVEEVSDPQIIQEEAENRRSLLTQSFVAEDNEEPCAICLQEFSQNRVIQLHCQHIFHAQCIQTWIKLKNSCPVCRKPQQN